MVAFLLYKWRLANRRAEEALLRSERLTNAPAVPRPRSPADTVPEFKVAPDLALQLLMAADFLDL